jgi:hypothetical protein
VILVRPIAADLLGGLAGRDRAELMADYLEPLSVLSLGSVLGVAHLGAAQLRDWFWRLQGVINFEGNPEREAVGTACSREIDQVLAPVSTGWKPRATTARSRTCCTVACKTAAAGPGIS